MRLPSTLHYGPGYCPDGSTGVWFLTCHSISGSGLLAAARRVTAPPPGEQCFGGSTAVLQPPQRMQTRGRREAEPHVGCHPFALTPEGAPSPPPPPPPARHAWHQAPTHPPCGPRSRGLRTSDFADHQSAPSTLWV